MHLRLPIRSILAATTLVLAGIAVAEEASEPTWQAKDMRVQNVVVRSAGDPGNMVPGHSIVVKTRRVSGEAPSTELTIVGDAGASEVFQVPDLEVGESRTFTTASGKAIEVKRMDRGIELAIDGKTIVLPGDDVLMAAPAGQGSGHREVRVLRVGPADQVEGDDDVVIHQQLPPGAVFVAGPGHGPGMGLGGVDFEGLETLKGLDPEVREKVVAALHEILSSRQFLSVTVTDDTDSPPAGQRETIVRERSRTPKAE